MEKDELILIVKEALSQYEKEKKDKEQKESLFWIVAEIVLCTIVIFSVITNLLFKVSATTHDQQSLTLFECIIRSIRVINDETVSDVELSEAYSVIACCTAIIAFIIHVMSRMIGSFIFHVKKEAMDTVSLLAAYVGVLSFVISWFV